jgi:3-hydroxy-9,10-secoandrosta-1,3,5(10)-triene-9,17-dione monooxygenase reductase component
MMTAFDQKLFRNALGMFATGITIVTTTGPTGEPIGMTVNSFASVSLDPPLVLWSVGQHANSFDIFAQTKHFAIHILGKNQEALSNLFASRGEDKFGKLAWQPGDYGSPILPKYAVCFQCQTEHTYPGGDHTILVGRVMAFDDRADGEALLYFRGQYRYI